MRKGNYITTYTGLHFYPLDPREEEIITEDIGHALSLLCRANGHYRHFYSVGQHSLHCAKEAEARGYSPRVQLACLLHDASEAYIADLTRPMKRELHTYLEIEAKLQGFIYDTYGLTHLTKEELDLVDQIDDAMLAYEMNELMSKKQVEEIELVVQHELGFTCMDKIARSFIQGVEMLQNKIQRQTV